jgi:hypothetical protein
LKTITKRVKASTRLWAISPISGQTVFQPKQEAKIAFIPKFGGDGFPCEIYESRWPSRFFKLVALPSDDSAGNQRPGFTLSTGSGAGIFTLIVRMAVAVSEGLLGVDHNGLGEGGKRV